MKDENTSPEVQVCVKHGETCLNIKNLLAGQKELKESWEERFAGYKKFFNDELDKIRLDISGAIKSDQEMKLTLVEMKNDIGNMSKDLATFITTFNKIQEKSEEEKKGELKEVRDEKKETRNKILYPVIVGSIMLFIGYIAGHIKWA